jgi:D-aminoacyl-tRNA deacylase
VIHACLLQTGSFSKTEKLFEQSPVYYDGNEITLITSTKDIVSVEGLDELFSDVPGRLSYVFISRHRAESGKPSLTAHFTGNFGTSGYGGNSEELSYTRPSLLKNYLLELEKERSDIPEKYGITIEATHHGPTSLRHPVLFVELGSSPNEWSDTNAANIIARCLIRGIRSEKKYPKVAIGLGGTHYSDKFNKVILHSETALSHIIPKYSLDLFTDVLLDQALQKTTETVSAAALDWKGLGKHKERIVQLARDRGLEIMKI